MTNPYLQIESGADSKRYDLELGIDEVIIGRSAECHWVVSSGAVSRRHARVRRQSGEITLEDLGSSNGTFVNGERLAEPKVLRDQDEVKLGSVEGRFFVPKPEPESDATISIGDLPQTIMVKPEPAATIMVPPPPDSSPPEPPAPAPAPAAAPPARAETSAPTMAAPAPSASQGVPAETMAAKPPPLEPAASGDTAFRPAPTFPTSPAQRTLTGVAMPVAVPAEAGPSLIELVVIAGASFLLVFGIGAILLRWVL